MNLPSYEKYIKMCFELAVKGKGKVSPNPLVGALVVKNGKIVGKGYHKKFGEAHAEVNAIKAAGKNSVGADLFVNLEPCSHYGKTPPCTDLIIKSKIKRVIISTRDPNPLVNGKGVQKLKDAGIEVVENILKDEAIKINEVFFKYMLKKLPFVALKIAQTMDSKIADFQGNSKWITNIESRKTVHKLRSSYDAVLIGANTVRRDNPLLNVRLVKGKNPVRIILNDKFNLNLDYKIFRNCNKITTYVLVSDKYFKNYSQKVKKFVNKNINIIPLKSKNGRIEILDVLNKLYEFGISSILVEGGQDVFTQFLNKKLADRIYFFIAPKLLGKGFNSFSNELIRTLKNPISLYELQIEKLNENILIQGKVKY